MPPIQQQQTSRAGLITALVISIIFGLGVLVWAFMVNADNTKRLQETERLRVQLKELVEESALSEGASPDLTYYRRLRGTGTTPLIDVSTRNRKQVVKLITGAEGDLEQAEAASKAAFDAIAAAKGEGPLKEVDIPTSSLTNAITALVNKIKADAGVIATAQADAKKAAEELAAEKTKYAEELKTRDAKVAEEAKRAVEAANSAQTATADKQKQVDDIGKRLTETEEKFNKLAATEEAAKQALQQEIVKLKAEITKYLSQLAMFKPDVKNAWIRNVDGAITQLAQDNRCYINLGFGDHIMPGLTFEVYGKDEGIPPIKPGTGTSMFDMPKGKGSIEVIDVGQNSSLCRIVVRQPGQQISQGDVCGNLVYDRNIKPKFFVFGDFDMDNNSVPTPAEAEIIKSIILRWGGKVSEKLDVDVDYLIIGKEPVIPNYTKEEIEGNARNAEQVRQAKEKLAAYNETLRVAAEFHIPVMNQNRFLYYTGYFDAAKR